MNDFTKASIASAVRCAVNAFAGANMINAKYITSVEAVCLTLVMLAWTVWDNRKKNAGSLPSPKITIPVSILLFAFVLSGCAINKPHMREEIIGTNGVRTIRELRATSYAIWPATQNVEKQKVTLGKTFAVGTEGITQETGGTNVTETVKALSDLLKNIR